MAKYSTGGTDGGGDGGTCELCGTATDDLHTVTVEGATLSVCSDCASLGETTGGPAADTPDESGSETERRKRAAQHTAKAFDAATGDSTHWEEEGTNYEGDRLPYLVADYGERVLRARQEAGYQREELAESMDIDENDLLAVEQGRATSASVGGSLIRALEAELDVELVEE
ncbi:helix-turn-helix domain-containing protein [Halodesulfurarchaeum formicicum]|uniref:Transcriptional regulator n=1 Tax=Halodesulfurarchaeum formicicum TaxID=1873524 RepID=A0A1J1AA58_9EURY|nr:multiprotein-bridging factor 1 family protein [Halodesulfurarchaeum formicicum]APE95020.1 transcriptional regulator [Halodesulfurarchaeum formicicum]